MKLFVWNNVDHVSDSYHDNGGVVAIAESLQRAREIIAEATRHAEKPCAAMTIEPDLSRECDGPEFIAIHPNAGCCLR